MLTFDWGVHALGKEGIRDQGEDKEGSGKQANAKNTLCPV